MSIEAMKQSVAAMNAMLTHMGMDEDEFNKVTFDQIRAAITSLRAAIEAAEKAEPVKFLADAMRYKICRTDELGCYIAGLPNELHGRWVALFAAEDGKHLKLTTNPTPDEITKLREEVAAWRSSASCSEAKRVEQVSELEIQLAAVTRKLDQASTDIKRLQLGNDDVLGRFNCHDWASLISHVKVKETLARKAEQQLAATQAEVEALRKELDANLQERVRLQSVINAYERGDLVSKYAAMQPAADSAGKGE